MRQLPTVTNHVVSTGSYQSDPPSLPEPIRCSEPQGRSPGGDPPLYVLLQIRNKLQSGLKSRTRSSN